MSMSASHLGSEPALPIKNIALDDMVSLELSLDQLALMTNDLHSLEL